MTTPMMRALSARLAAHERWSRTSDRTAATAAARASGPASLAYFERQVDPDGSLPEAKRQLLAVNARKAHFTRLSLAAARARSLRNTA